MQDAELSVRCETQCGCGGLFLIQVFDEAGREITRRHAQAGTVTRFQLRGGAYTLRVSNRRRFNPGGISTSLRLACGDCRQVRLLFSSPLPLPAAAQVLFSAADANLPGITPINGGISVWRQAIIPLNL
jgi:hypothetical protein